jgi:hypothetical protein
MATDLTINIDLPKTQASVCCNYAQQCLWYEAPAQASSSCINRDTLVCQKHCEEVFGHQDSQKTSLGY